MELTKQPGWAFGHLLRGPSLGFVRLLKDVDEMYERMQKLSAELGTETRRDGGRFVIDVNE